MDYRDIVLMSIEEKLAHVVSIARRLEFRALTATVAGGRTS